MNRKDLEKQVGDLESKVTEIGKRTERTDDAVAMLVGLFKYSVVTLAKTLDTFMSSRGVAPDSDARKVLDRLVTRVRKVIPSTPEDEG